MILLNTLNLITEYLILNDLYYLIPELLIFISILWSLFLSIYINGRNDIRLTLRLNRFMQIILILSLSFYVTILLHEDWTNTVYLCNLNCHFTFSVVIIKIIILILTLLLLEAYSALLLYDIRAYTSNYVTVLSLTMLFFLTIVCSTNFLTFFIGMVGFSLGTYILLFKNTEFSPLSRESGIKYYYLSTFSSGLFLYGICLTYYIFGTLNFATIRDWIHHAIETGYCEYETNILIFCLVFLILGLLFKISLFPCHLWTPEIYEGSPDLITAVFILPMKLVTVFIASNIITYVYEQLLNLWQPILVISAIGSLLWGSFAAIFESRIKKFLAYTSINQLGFLLLGFLAGTETAYNAMYFHLHIYIIMNTILILIYLWLRILVENSITYITDLANYNVLILGISYPIISLLIPTIFSMIGIPPLAGFFSKYLILLETMKVSFNVPVICALITSLISCYYYINIIKISLFDYSTRNIIVVFPKQLLVCLLALTFYLCCCWLDDGVQVITNILLINWCNKSTKRTNKLFIFTILLVTISEFLALIIWLLLVMLIVTRIDPKSVGYCFKSTQLF